MRGPLFRTLRISCATGSVVEASEAEAVPSEFIAIVKQVDVSVAAK
jgi:hypothetical protein